MTFLLAQAGLDIAIYFVIGVIWIISNIMQQKAAKRKKEALKKRREEEEKEARRTGKPLPSQKKKSRSLEDDLETFLGRLAGEPTPAQQQKPSPPPSPPKQRTTPPPLKPKIEFDNGRGPRTSRKAVQASEIKVGAKIRRAARIEDMDMSKSFHEIEDLKEIKDISSEMLSTDVRQEALESVRSMMVDLSPTTLELITIPTQSVRPVRTRTSRPKLTRAANVRRALVNSVIIDQPKALQEQPFKETP